MSQATGKGDLNLKGSQEQSLMKKFKQREEQTSLEEALVYLKLRQYQCGSRKALIFSKKQQYSKERKEKGIDGTLNRDGPAGFRKLQVTRPESKLVNGWLRGQKLKYAGTTGYSDFLRKHESAEKKMITTFNQKIRIAEQEMRKDRSKSTVAIDMSHPRQSIERIGAIKQEASRQRQNRNMYVQYSGVRLDQTTKTFFKQAERLDEEGLIVKLGAFDHIIADKNLTINVDLGNMKGKSLTIAEITGTSKRDNILDYQDKIKSFKEKGQVKGQLRLSWQKLISKTPNEGKEIIFRKTSIQEASNPLILMDSKQLKKDLVHDEKKYIENMTSYSNFYQNIDKAMKMQFLSKRKFSHSELGSSKKNRLQIEDQNYL